MNDLFAAFGISKEDFKTKEPVKKKKSEKGKEKKGHTYGLPISFGLGHLRHVFSGEAGDAWSVETLRSQLEKVFPELTGMHFKLIPLKVGKKEEGVVSYFTADIFYTECKEKELQFPLDIVAGSETLQVDVPVSLEEMQALWVQAHPEYTGCKFHYSEKQNMLFPYMKENAPGGKKYPLPMTVGYLDIRRTYQETDFNKAEVTADELRDKYAAEFPEFRECGFAYQENLRLLFPVPGKHRDSESVIALPVEIRAGGFTLLVQPEDVQGKTAADLDTIRQALERIYPEYSRERTEMLYDKRHFVVPILKSSRKGAVLSFHTPGRNSEMVTDSAGNTWRKETMPFGVFRYNVSRNGPVRFTLTAPKIPRRLLYGILDIFERVPNLEHALQIFYDSRKGIYELYEPDQTADSSSVVFTRDVQKELTMALVMDIHSHGRLPAFFSTVDDRDEKGVRLYMVVGNLDKNPHTHVLRAGLAGHYAPLALEDVFAD